MLLPTLREIVCSLHVELPRNQLVTWTSGDISARDRETGLIVIKPSGIKFSDLTPERMVVVDEHGTLVEGDLQPSSDHPLTQLRTATSIGICPTFMVLSTHIRVTPQPLPSLASQSHATQLPWLMSSAARFQLEGLR